MSKAERDATVRLDLNNFVFQRDLLGLQKAERHATLAKLHQLTWNQIYRDKGPYWEKIASLKPLPGIDALYSLRITQAPPAVAYRAGAFIRLLSIPPHHDATYGRK